MTALYCFIAVLLSSVVLAWTPGSFRSAETDVAAAAAISSGFILLGGGPKSAAAAHLDPSDFFTGALHRPRLEILHPENGQVLDNGDLEIKIKIDGLDYRHFFSLLR